jgi:hypothetical protein
MLYGTLRLTSYGSIWEYNPKLKLTELEQIAHNLSIDPEFKVIRVSMATVIITHPSRLSKKRNLGGF